MFYPFNEIYFSNCPLWQFFMTKTLKRKLPLNFLFLKWKHIYSMLSTIESSSNLGCPLPS